MKKFISHFLFLAHIFLWTFISVTQGQNTCPCEPLPPAQGNIIQVSTVNELIAALQSANTSNGHVTILMAKNTYQLTGNLPFIGSNMTGLTIRGATGDRDDVIIRGVFFCIIR